MAQSSTARAWARGGVVFAATVLLLVGIYQIFLGIAAIAQNAFFVVGPNYAYRVDTTTWGWIHLGIGIVAVVAGLFLFTGQMWARILGVAMAVLSATANFFFLPYYPIWSALIIGLDVFAIWAIANAGKREMMADTMGMSTGAFAGEAEQAGQRWPATNQPAGRHWAGEPAKEGMADRAAAERERAESMTRQGQQPMGGQQGTGQTGPPRDPGTPTS